MKDQEFHLDEEVVDLISSRLRELPEMEPHVLKENEGRGFYACRAKSPAFIFRNKSDKNALNSIAEMTRLIKKDPRNAELIFPFIGGKELNTSPIHAHHRYVINFGNRSEVEARKWPDLFKIIEEKTTNYFKAKRFKFWLFAGRALLMQKAIKELNRVLVVSRIGKTLLFTFLPNNMVYSDQLVVFPFSDYATLSLLQSRIHEVWVRQFSSSLKSDLRYSITHCFFNFPFPPNWQCDESLEKAGKSYYNFRANLMIENLEGLTKTYNRFHDLNNQDSSIIKLRQLHANLDRAVFDAYGWNDVKTEYDYFDSRLQLERSVQNIILKRLMLLNQTRFQNEN